VGHLLLAIPFYAAFHLRVRGRPLQELWARDTNTFARSRVGKTGVLAVVVLIVAALVLQSASSDRWIDDSWTVLLTAGTFALGYVLLRRLLVVVTVTAVLMSIVAGVSAPRLSTDSNGDIQLLGRLTAMQEHGELAGYQDLAVADINLDSPQPVRLAGLGATATTPMEVRSLTKAMTGLVIADAVARGEVRMDAPVSAYLPQLWGSAAGVSSATFGYLSHFTREGVLRWLSGKHRRLVDHDQHRGAGREPKPRSRHAKVASPTITPSNDMRSHDRSEPHPPPSPAVGARRRPHP